MNSIAFVLLCQVEKALKSEARKEMDGMENQCYESMPDGFFHPYQYRSELSNYQRALDM